MWLWQTRGQRKGSKERIRSDRAPTADSLLKEEDQEKSENVSIIDSEATTEYQASESSGESTDRFRWVYDWTKQEPEYELSDELHFSTISSVALQADMNKIVTKGSGRLMARNARKLKQMRLSFQTHWLNLQDDIEIIGFLSGRNGIGADRKARFENVCHSLFSLLDSHLEASFRSEISEKHTDEDCIRAYLGLKDMFDDMKNMSWFTDADKLDSDGILHHWNLQARSIMVDRTEGLSSPWRVTGIIDWDLTYTLPLVEKTTRLALGSILRH
jgi:hypothetical protein